MYNVADSDYSDVMRVQAFAIAQPFRVPQAHNFKIDMALWDY